METQNDKDKAGQESNNIETPAPAEFPEAPVKPVVPGTRALGIDNNGGRLKLTLPSGRVAVLRPYDAYVANAIGDQALQDEGTNFDKALCGLIETLDGDAVPNFDTDRFKALEVVRGLLLNDYHWILFMACASYREGLFEGDIPDQEGDEFFGQIHLFDPQGNPLQQFIPDIYPNGDERVCKWTEDLPKLGETEMMFNLLDGSSRADMLDTGVDNLNAFLIGRKARWYRKDISQLEPYNPATRPPSSVSKALTAKMREIDPTIQYSVKVRNRGRRFTISLFQIHDFFLRDFI